jgi:hypothetical protein
VLIGAVCGSDVSNGMTSIPNFSEIDPTVWMLLRKNGQTDSSKHAKTDSTYHFPYKAILMVIRNGDEAWGRVSNGDDFMQD